LVKRSLVTLQVAHSEELEALQKLLHFPEEVALRLADTEYHLFYQVPPIDYLRQVTLDLGAGTGDVPPPAPGPGLSDHRPPIALPLPLHLLQDLRFVVSSNVSMR
ncbi:hypothetical protein L9F63_016744, partial [Diploptera punctata]